MTYPSRQWRLAGVAWATALWPVVIIHLAYLNSAASGHLDWCWPYLDGCTSISAAARSGSSIYLFRATMLPWAALLALYWWLAAQWCQMRVPRASVRRVAMLVCGWGGTAFYLLYATFLGEDGELQRLLRRYGINLYFALTVLAQMWLISIVAQPGLLHRAHRLGFLLLFAALILLGLASLPLQFWVDDRKALLNAIEWWYALLMVVTYALTGLVWRREGWRLQWVTGASSAPGGNDLSRSDDPL